MKAAIDEGSRTGISGLDAVHVACAVVGEAAELITSEKSTKPIHRTSAVTVVSINCRARNSSGLRHDLAEEARRDGRAVDPWRRDGTEGSCRKSLAADPLTLGARQDEELRFWSLRANMLRNCCNAGRVRRIAAADRRP